MRHSYLHAGFNPRDPGSSPGCGIKILSCTVGNGDGFACRCWAACTGGVGLNSSLG